ncbi:MAG: ABC transporter permease [Myxococcales bacterium]|nr:ABC transporter permease [Myxococcales bacterium]
MADGMARYLALRFLRAVATVFGVCTLVFLLVHLIPGDPIDAILGDQAAPEDRVALRKSLHLDEPLATQYLRFGGSLLDGSLGHSYRASERTVSSLMAEVLPHTAVLALASLLVAFALAIPLGALAAYHRGRAWDRSASGLAMLGLAIPNIWLGPLLVLFFGVRLQLLPLPGDDPTRASALVLPAFTVGTALMAILTRQTRAALIEVLGQPYILAARARGVGAPALLFDHALRNALLPVMTVGAAQLGALLSGTVITEKIFERPGLGTLFLDAFFARDIPVVQGCVLVIAVIYVAVNLLLDLLYAAADPRVRLR